MNSPVAWTHAARRGAWSCRVRQFDPNSTSREACLRGSPALYAASVDHEGSILDVGGSGVRQATPALVQECAELFERLEVGLDGALRLALRP
jgi:hypothetical protein